MREIQNGILTGKSELGKKLMMTNARSLFSTKIFHEMEGAGIDVKEWITNSYTM